MDRTCDPCSVKTPDFYKSLAFMGFTEGIKQSNTAK